MIFTTKILKWFKDYGRSLPWRDTHDPYSIWLSEVILQQTRIEQGLPYWQRFIERWPTVEDLAAATEDEVLREWQGLGYYSRARHLHEAARQIVEWGGFPTTLEGIRKIKGVGDYTAAAIGSIAFGLPVAAVDGNVYRVLSRSFGIGTPINTLAGKRVFSELAQHLLPPQQASDFNQAMMDFGATQCTPQRPLCHQCPLHNTCVALIMGRVDELPVKLKTTKVQERHLTYIYVRYQGETAFRRRPAGDIWQGLWEPILVENEPMSIPSGRFTMLKNQVRHVLTHRVILADFWLWEPWERPDLPEGYQWIKESDIDQYALPRLVEILLETLA